LTPALSIISHKTSATFRDIGYHLFEAGVDALRYNRHRRCPILAATSG